MTPMQLPDPNLPWPIAMDGVYMIANYEQGPKGGVALTAYKCPSGVWTIGWGETEGVVPGQTTDKAQADQWLCEDLTRRANAVRAMCTDAPDQYQLAALVSLAYNIGLRDDEKKRGLYYSTVLRCHNAGDAEGASRAFGLFNKGRVKGVLTVFPGLVARRASEAALYLKNDPELEPVPQMPQAVEAESSMAASPINITAAVPVVGGGVTVLSAFSDQVQELVGKLHTLADALGVQLPTVLGAVAVIGGGIVIWNRFAQRRGGWA